VLTGWDLSFEEYIEAHKNSKLLFCWYAQGVAIVFQPRRSPWRLGDAACRDQRQGDPPQVRAGDRGTDRQRKGTSLSAYPEAVGQDAEERDQTAAGEKVRKRASQVFINACRLTPRSWPGDQA
jgi:hypothetical protein